MTYVAITDEYQSLDGRGFLRFRTDVNDYHGSEPYQHGDREDIERARAIGRIMASVALVCPDARYEIEMV